MKTEKRRTIHVTHGNRERRWLNELVVHLSTGMPDVDVRTAAVSETDPTTDKPSIAETLETVDVIIMLVSDELIASSFFKSVELPEIVHAAQTHGTLVLPILVSPCSWENTPLGVFRLLNSPTTPLVNLSSEARDAAYIGIVDRLNAVLSQPATPDGDRVASADFAEAIRREVFVPFETDVSSSPKRADPGER